MVPHVVVLGAGVGGTLVANRVARRRPAWNVTVVDTHADHIFQPGLLYLPLNRKPVESLERAVRSLLDPRIELRAHRVEGIDLATREVRLEGNGALTADAVVVATGSRVDPREIPGFYDGAFHFHCRHRAIDLRAQLEDWRGGRIVVGASRFPYKCPPSPVEFTLLLDAWLRRCGLRAATQLTYVSPAPRVVSHEPVADLLEPLLRERGVAVRTAFAVSEIDPAGKRLVAAGGDAEPYDLLILVPPHTPAPFLRGSPLVDDTGWVRTDPRTLRAGERIYALGDTANLPIPKTGSGARLQSEVVAANIVAELEGRGPIATYDGGVT